MTNIRICSCRSAAARRAESPVPDDHLHGPAYLEFDHGVEHFAA